MPALGFGPVGYHDHVVAGGRLTLPAVHQVEQVAAHHDGACRGRNGPVLARQALFRLLLTSYHRYSGNPSQAASVSAARAAY